MNSIRQRLSLGLTVVLAILLLGQGLWLTLTFDNFIERQVVNDLQDETETLLANLSVDHNAQMMLKPPSMSSSYNRPFSGRYFVIQTNEQKLYSRSLWDANLEVDPTQKTGERQIHRLMGPRQQPLLAVSVSYFKRNLPITITVAEDISWMQAEKQRFQWLFGVLSIVAALLLIALQVWVIRHALKPLKTVQFQLKQLAAGAIDKIDETSAEELRPLLSELNRLLNGMVVKTRRSRQALGNLAHRLKTQLSLLNQIAETPLIKQDPITQQALYQQTEDIRQIIDRELKRARVSGFAMPGRGVDLQALVSQLDETLHLIHRDKTFVFHYQIAPGIKFNGDREDLLELLGNLLDNACKWCDQRIELTIGTAQNGINILLQDDGPGCDIGDLSTLAQRGFRADESKPGSGLGLAIVFDIVESYQGSMQFSISEKWKGLQIEIYLQAV